MEEREPRLGVAVGRKGCGKTYTTTKMLEQYVRGNPAKGVAPRRVLIFDVNDEFEKVKALKISDVMKFSVHPTIEIRRVRPFNDDGTAMGINEMQEALAKILFSYRGGLMLIEDTNKYISDYLPQDLIGKIISSRHVDLDIIMHFQSIGRVSPKIWQNINWLRFHKNTDFVERHKNKFENYYEMLTLVESYVNAEYEAGNKRIYVYIEIDDEKIILNNKAKFQKVVEDYLILNQRKLLAPLTQKNILVKGSKALTLEEALKVKTQQLMRQYTL